MRKWMIPFYFLCASVLGWWAYEKYQDDFNLKNITWDYPFNFSWIPPPLSPNEQQKIDQILSQKFSYLDKGHQVYAFESEDQKYVLKFINFSRLKPNPEWTQEQKTRFDRVFKGFILAFQKDKENTALLYLNLLQTGMEGKKILIKTRFGKHYTVDLTNTVFVLQKKATPSRKVLKELKEKRDISKIKERLRQIIALYLDEYRRGIYDSDHNVLYNTGFIGDAAIRIDVGRLKADAEFKRAAIYKKDLEKIIDKRISRWLKLNLPEYHDEILLDLKTFAG